MQCRNIRTWRHFYSIWGMFYFTVYCCDKITWCETNLFHLITFGHSPSLRVVKAGIQGEKEPGRVIWSREHKGNLFSGLFHGLLSVFSCIVQGPLPRFGTTHSWLDLPTSAINPNTQQACLHANRMEVFFQDNSSFCQVHLHLTSKVHNDSRVSAQWQFIPRRFEADVS